jgi:hypothetical protein
VVYVVASNNPHATPLLQVSNSPSRLIGTGEEIQTFFGHKLHLLEEQYGHSRQSQPDYAHAAYEPHRAFHGATGSDGSGLGLG